MVSVPDIPISADDPSPRIGDHDPLASDIFKDGSPRIGLALGGGAARGWAHIGVLEVLHEAGIVPDVIAGTSVGAIAGGWYSAGLLADLKEFALSLTPRRVFSLLDLTLLSSGLIAGHKIDDQLRDHLQDRTLEDLPIRTIFLATELATGHEIWLRRGNLVDAMGASYALPGIFKPVTVNGRALVDGALVNPVPVSVCRAYGARLVIAVSLTPESMPHGGVVPDLPDFDSGMRAGSAGSLFDEADEDNFKFRDMFNMTKRAKSVLRHQFATGKNGPNGVPAVMMQAFTIIQDRMTRSRLAGDPPDVMISPHIGDIGMFDFHRAESAIEAGREAAQKALDDIAIVTERLSVR